MSKPIIRVVCKDHPAGPLVLQVGSEPTVETECEGCLHYRLDREGIVHRRNSTAWQRRRAQTPEEIAAAPDPFKGFRKGEG